MKISDRQRAVLFILRHGGSVRYCCSPGADEGGYFFEVEGNHNDADARTVNSLIDRRFLEIKPRDDVYNH
jgi:hypothetical protein